MNLDLLTTAEPAFDVVSLIIDTMGTGLLKLESCHRLGSPESATGLSSIGRGQTIELVIDIGVSNNSRVTVFTR